MGLAVRLREAFQALAGRTEVIARLIPSHQADKPLALPQDFKTLADEGYRKNVIIYACVNVLVRAAAEVRIVVQRRRRDGELEAVENELSALLARPNPEQSTYEWLEQFDLHYQCSGNGYVHKVRSAAGRVVELWNLRPDKTRIVPGADGMVAKYAYSTDGATRRSVGVLPEDVIHLKRPDPLNDYYGLSPIAVAASVGDLDNNAIKYLRVFFENNGIPGGFVQIKERNLTAEQKDDLKSQFQDRYRGENGWHAIGILDAEASYIEVGANPQKLNLASVFGETESRICAAFGVPPIIVAVWIGLMRSTYANYETALKDLWVDTQSPKYRRIADKLTAQLAPEFGDDLVINFDLSKVEALQENKEELRKFALEGWNGGLFYRNQALEMAGVVIVDGPVGDEYKTAGSAIPPMNGQMQARVLTVPPLMIAPGETHLLDVDANADEPEWRQLHRAADTRSNEMRKAFMAAVRKTRSAIDEEALTSALNKNSPYEAELEIPWERLGTHSLEEDFLELLADVFTSAARATKIPDRQSTAPTERHAQQIDLPLELADEWAELKVAELIREVGDETKEAIRQIINRRFTDESFTTLRAVRQIMRAVGLTRRQETAVDKVLDKLLADGVPFDEASLTADKKARAMHRYRAKMIARTEGIRAASGGQEAVWREAVNQGVLPPQQEQFWIVTPDDRLDQEVCAPMEGQRRKIGEAFTTGTGGTVMAPPAHPQCRCARGLVL